jgi:hypothetical protein
VDCLILVGAGCIAFAFLMWQSASSAKGLLRTAIRLSALCLALFGVWNLILGPPETIAANSFNQATEFSQLTGFSLGSFASLITCART